MASSATLARGKQTRRYVLVRDTVEEWEDGVHFTTHHYGGVRQARTDFLLYVRTWKEKGWRLVELVDPKKKAASRKAVDPLVEECDEVLAMWRDDEYDNLKDAILDARSLLARARKRRLARYVTRLEKMLRAAQKELAREAKKDPEIAAYAKGLLG